jgi:cell wall-associated NlpC family hydrolase
MDFLAKYIGIPYKHKGRTLKDGLDCWGLVLLIYKDLGYKLRDLDDYEMSGHLKGHNYFEPRDEWVMNGVPKPYDVALFLNTEGIAYHAGVITPDLKMIHASKNVGVQIVPLDAVLKKIRIDGYYNLKAKNDNDKIQS